MSKKMNYQQNLEYHLTYGQDCKDACRGNAKPFAVSYMDKLVQVTYICSHCFHIQDTLYNKSWYLKACFNLGLNPHTLKPADELTESENSDNAAN